MQCGQLYSSAMPPPAFCCVQRVWLNDACALLCCSTVRECHICVKDAEQDLQSAVSLLGNYVRHSMHEQALSCW